MTIKEIKNISEKWFQRYLYENSSEKRSYRNQWSEKMDETVLGWNRTISFTGVTTGLGSLRRNVCVENNRQFFNRLHSSVFRKKKDKTIQRWVVVEFKEGREFLSHMILGVPIHLNHNQFIDKVISCWEKTKFGKKKNPQNKVIEVCYPSEKAESKFTKETGDFSLGFGGYTTKQFKRTTDIVDTDNSYWI